MLATALIPLLMLSSPIQGREQQILRQFAVALENYAQLHRDASESVPRALCGGPEELEVFRTGLADEIRRLRTHAREGDIFTREVGALLRRWLRAQTPAVTADDEDTETGPDGRAIAWTAEVNAGYPPYFGVQHRELWGLLPALPGELEYRFVGRDLVLVDVIANLVVDVLRDAIGSQAEETRGGVR